MVNVVIGCLLAGAVGTTVAEHFLKINFADEVIDVFRSTEKRGKLLEQRAVAAVKAFEAATKKRFDAIRNAL